MPEDKTLISFELDVSLNRRLGAEAKLRDTSKRFLLTELIRTRLDSLLADLDRKNEAFGDPPCSDP